MKRTPITYLAIDTSSSNDYVNGDCDFCLVQMTPQYVGYLLDLMDQVRRMHRADKSVYTLKCWDFVPLYFGTSDKFQELRDVDGAVVADIQPGEPILLTADPGFTEDDFQRTECQTVQVARDVLWWAAHVRHTDIRIESAQIEKQTLLRIRRSLGGAQPAKRPEAKPIHPALRKIHDLLYLDVQNGRKSYDADKSWNPDTIAAVAEIVAEFIPRPPHPPDSRPESVHRPKEAR